MGKKALTTSKIYEKQEIVEQRSIPDGSIRKIVINMKKEECRVTKKYQIAPIEKRQVTALGLIFYTLNEC